jgi:hypothetical protein
LVVAKHRSDRRQRLHPGDALDAVGHRGRNGHGAHSLLVTFVPHVHDPIALAGSHLDLVVDLGHQRAHTVDDVGALGPGGSDDLRGRTVRGEHDRRAVGHVGDVVDEHHPEGLEPVDDDLVVDDLVVAVDRRVERAHHPREGLDRHLDAGAEAPGGGEQHAVDVHLAEATDDGPPVALPP